MKRLEITVTKAAKNFADCVNRVRSQGSTYVLLKHGKPVARLGPEKAKVCTGRELAEALSKVELTADEAGVWHKDLVRARKLLTAR